MGLDEMGLDEVAIPVHSLAISTCMTQDIISLSFMIKLSFTVAYILFRDGRHGGKLCNRL